MIGSTEPMPQYADNRAPRVSGAVRKLLARAFRSSFFARAGVLTVAQALSMVIGLGSTIIWTRMMPVELFGQFRVVLAVLGFVAAFCLLGQGQAAMMSAARNIDGNLHRLVRTKVAFNGLGSLALLGIAGYYAWEGGSSRGLAFALVAAAVIFPIYNLSDVWTSWVNGKGEFGRLALSRVAPAVVGAVTVLAAAYFGVTQLWAVLLAFVGGSAAFTAIMLSFSYKATANTDTDTSLIALGHHSSVAMAFSGILALDVVALNHFYSAQDVAIYAIAQQFPDLLKPLFSALGAVLVPRIYAATSFGSIWREIRVPFLFIISAGVTMGVVGFFILEPVTVLLFSARYASAAEFGRWLWFTMACLGGVPLLLPALLATKKRVFIYIPYSVYPILLAALYALFVSQGIQGLITAKIIAFSALCAFYVGGFLYCLRSSDTAVVGKTEIVPSSGQVAGESIKPDSLVT